MGSEVAEDDVLITLGNTIQTYALQALDHSEKLEIAIMAIKRA